METMTSATKRKKRKTRKCLDEIRRRSSRSRNLNSSFKKTPIVGTIRETISSINDKRHPISSNYITSNRLTLAMFPKAIRSETITRPIHSEIKHNASNITFNKIVNNVRPTTAILSGGNIQPSNRDCDFIKNSDQESISSEYERCEDIRQMPLQKGSDSKSLSNGDISPGSLILFSPMHQTADTDMFEESQNGQSVLSTSTTSSSQSVTEGYGYRLYEEFMNEIPIYFKENASALIKEDVMKKTKTFLHNIYVDSCRRECEDNILQCIKTNVSTSSKPFTKKETILRNPMDYLRLGYAWRQSAASAPAPASPAAPPSPAPASPAAPPSPAPSLIRDTPEYTYYPHKLNQ